MTQEQAGQWREVEFREYRDWPGRKRHTYYEEGDGFNERSVFEVDGPDPETERIEALAKRLFATTAFRSITSTWESTSDLIKSDCRNLAREALAFAREDGAR